ncbi:MAG: VWA domain-containing protein, partial [Spongiibacteraceae bacterium]|nr:VWA domain-containing protein [Spongiibacteraceae bacterium]
MINLDGVIVEFAYPWFFILVFFPLLVRKFAPVYKEQKQSLQVPYFQRLVAVTGQTPQSGAVLLQRKFVQAFLLGIGWLCIVIAMAKPEIVGAPIVQKKSARDLMIAVDLSGSMAVEDFTTTDDVIVNRLEAVKQVLTEFVQGRQHDRLGLILFGDAPYLQAPFTDDLDTWLTLLNESEIGIAGQSTAFGDAIGLAISVFNNAETKNRVLIVLTDGNDTGSKVPPIEAAKVAATFNIKIYSIAIGDPEAAGEEKVNLNVLEQMTQVTGGKNFKAMNREELQAVYQQIDALEPQLFESLSFRPRVS